MAGLAAGCGAPGPEHPAAHGHDHDAGDHDHAAPEAAGESWSVIAWGEIYELFPEVDALVAGHAAAAHVHVTVLDGFAPLTEGSVEVILRDPGTATSRGQVFRGTAPVRPGIYSIDLQPEAPGEYELAFRIASAAGEEEIPGGRVRVGTAGEPGGLVEGPAADAAAPPAAGEPLTFLKEQQWRTAFATAWVEHGSLRRSVRGLGWVRPAAGGEIVLTAPVAAVVQPSPWPYLGQEVRRGGEVLRLLPQISEERSLAELEAVRAEVESERAAAADRFARLEELLALEAASRKDVEEARARLAGLEARAEAARRDLEAARAARRGGGAGAETVALTSPFDGRVAGVAVSPGQAVDAGAPLARLVRPRPLWLEVALAPEAAAQLGGQAPAGLIVTPPGEAPAIRFDAEDLRLVSRAPEIDPATGTLAVLLEMAGAGVEALPLGTVAATEVLLGETVEGIVVPATALVDDGGVAVVYVQADGESFLRREVEVVALQGDRALVEGLAPGERLVTRGGGAIRRASLMAGGAVEGHVH
jgi:RND family efflux transporter MFP subunit